MEMEMEMEMEIADGDSRWQIDDDAQRCTTMHNSL